MQQIAANNSFFLILNLVVLTSGSKPNRNLMSFEISNMSSLKPPSEVYFIHWKLFKIASWKKKGENMWNKWDFTGFLQEYPTLGKCNNSHSWDKKNPKYTQQWYFSDTSYSQLWDFIVSNNLQCCDFVVPIFSHYWDFTVSTVSVYLEYTARLGIAFPSLKRTWKISFLFDFK